MESESRERDSAPAASAKELPIRRSVILAERNLYDRELPVI